MQPDSAEQFLIDDIRQGNEGSWRSLVDRYTGRLLAFAKTQLGSNDAEDVVQETLIGFVQSLANFDSRRSLETYLFTILRYKIIDVLRQRKLNVLQVPADEEEWWNSMAISAEESPSQVARKREAFQSQGALLGDALRWLIDDLRDQRNLEDLQVIELVFFVGKRNLEIAELLDIDQKAVAGIKFRTIQKLRAYLKEREADSLAELDELSAEQTVARVWREQRLTCLKRSTIGSYLLDVLDESWRSYTQFHLDVVGCPLCLANHADLKSEEGPRTVETQERFFASSVGFMRRDRPG